MRIEVNWKERERDNLKGGERFGEHERERERDEYVCEREKERERNEYVCERERERDIERNEYV